MARDFKSRMVKGKPCKQHTEVYDLVLPNPKKKRLIISISAEKRKEFWAYTLPDPRLTVGTGYTGQL
jgi:hypothetical protein